MRPSTSTRHARELEVPWSRARIRGGGVLIPSTTSVSGREAMAKRRKKPHGGARRALGDQALALLDHDLLVGFHSLHHLPRAVRELQLHLIRLRGAAQPEEGGQLALAAVAGAAADP